jgi:hypothetical protein
VTAADRTIAALKRERAQLRKAVLLACEIARVDGKPPADVIRRIEDLERLAMPARPPRKQRHRRSR